MLSASIEPWLETRLLPTLTRAYPCRFTFYVADPVSSIQGPHATSRHYSVTQDLSMFHVDPH